MMGCLSVLFISETWIRERTYSYILIRYSLYSEIKIRYKAYSEIPIRKKAYIFTLSLSFFHAFPFIGVKLQFIVFIALIILKNNYYVNLFEKIVASTLFFSYLCKQEYWYFNKIFFYGKIFTTEKMLGSCCHSILRRYSNVGWRYCRVWSRHVPDQWTWWLEMLQTKGW